MKKFSPFVFFLLFLFCECASPNGSTTDKIPAKSADTASAMANKNTFIVSEPQIVFSWPDSISMIKMKSEDSDAFYTTADDNSFYNSQAMDIADSAGIKTASTNITKLDFITSDKKHFIIDRASKDGLQWGIFLYNGIDSPSISNGLELDKTYLENFFKKQK